MYPGSKTLTHLHGLEGGRDAKWAAGLKPLDCWAPVWNQAVEAGGSTHGQQELKRPHERWGCRAWGGIPGSWNGVKKSCSRYLSRVTVCEAAIQGPGRTGDWAKPASGLVRGSAVPLTPQLTTGLGVWTAGPTGPVPGPVTVPGREGARLFSWNRSAHGNSKLDNPKTSTP